MNNLINKLLIVLKDRVYQNKSEIQQNQDEIDMLLSGKQSIRKDELQSRYDLNSELLKENSDFIKLQTDLKEFMERYKHLFSQSPSETLMGADFGMGFTEIFENTVNGKMTFDASHPHFKNPAFIKELIHYYESLENYEMCNILLKLHRQ